MADVVDKLGMQKEFEDAPAPAPAPAAEKPAEAPQKFFREIDLKDGSGIQRFEADTQELLLDKLADAHANATRKIQELSRERKRREPEKHSSDWQEIKASVARPEDAAEVERFRRLFLAEIGVPPQEFIQQENTRRRQAAEAQAQNEFLRAHGEYNPTPDNAQKIFKLLEREGLPLSRRNLDWAYGELQGELEPRKGSTDRTPPTETPAPAPPRAPEVSRSTPPSFMRPSVGARDEFAGGGQEAEIARIAQSASLPEAKARIEQYFRQQRSSAR